MARLNFSKRQWATVLVLAVADFCSAVCVSLQAPFYPREAEMKGASASEYGLVFGIFELTVFLISPLYGYMVGKYQPKTIFNVGLFVTGLCSVLFGLLDRVEGHAAFMGLSFAIRIAEALGNAAFLTASFAIVAAEFPGSVATTFASLETFFGLGLIVGPTVGGALYQTGGYLLPFVTLGAFLFVAAALTYCILPKHDVTPNPRRNGGLLRMLSIPSVLIAAFSVLAASIAIGFLSATLEPHLRQFGLSPIMMGVMFIIEGGTYAVTAPIWGYLCDRHLQPRVVTCFGAILVAVGFMLVGPVPFWPGATSLPLSITGLVIVGFGVGAELVAGFISALQEATYHGFSNSLSTYGTVSALWTSTFALGAFIGPSIAGVLFDHVGFPYSTLFVIATHGLLVISCVLFLCCAANLPLGTMSCPRQNSYERFPEISSSPPPSESKDGTPIAIKRGFSQSQNFQDSFTNNESKPLLEQSV